jgi:hypothetical protein
MFAKEALCSMSSLLVCNAANDYFTICQIYLALSDFEIGNIILIFIGIFIRISYCLMRQSAASEDIFVFLFPPLLSLESYGN